MIEKERENVGQKSWNEVKIMAAVKGRVGMHCEGHIFKVDMYQVWGAAPLNAQLHTLLADLKLLKETHLLLFLCEFVHHPWWWKHQNHLLTTNYSMIKNILITWHSYSCKFQVCWIQNGRPTYWNTAIFSKKNVTWFEISVKVTANTKRKNYNKESFLSSSSWIHKQLQKRSNIQYLLMLYSECFIQTYVSNL